jgi:mono/diheme cytochrome c family protein
VRVLAANLDGRGSKAMPGICTNCHGGRGDPLTAADASGNQLFAVVGNPASGVRGDLKGKLHFFEPDTFSFSSLPSYTRAEQEDKIKTLNQWVLCSYPLPTSAVVPTGYAEDDCRTAAPTTAEWQGGAAKIVKVAYGGDGMPNATYSDNYVPASWATVGQSSLYRNVVQPTCRMCHILRGTGDQSDTDFSTYESFRKQAEDIRSHVVDIGNMPSTKVLYSRYWATPKMYNELNAFLLEQTPNPASNPFAATPDTAYRVLDAASAPARAGRPIASAGPSRTVSSGSSTLDAKYSMFADTYQWSIYSSPASAVSSPATLSSASAVQTTFTATVDGTYVVKLVVSKGTVQSDPSYIALVVNSALTPLPSAIRFADIKNAFKTEIAANHSCVTCHTATPAPGAFVSYPSYNDVDRNGDGIVASGVGETDDLLFYNEIRGLINFTEVADSPLLRKPAGHSHNNVPLQDLQYGFGNKWGTNNVSADELEPGNGYRSYYDLFLNWILNGAPYQ